MDIIIVGCGKAGYLHLNAYWKLRKIGNIQINNIFLIDTSGYISQSFLDFLVANNIIFKFFNSFESLLQGAVINAEETIIDLCIDFTQFIFYIESFLNLGCKNFILEKPAIFSLTDFTILERVNIFKVENYLYSKAHYAAKCLINEYELSPVKVFTDFSKDRRVDTFKKRGVGHHKNASVFLIEIPHQIYICNDLFGFPNKIMHVQSEDIIINDVVFPRMKSGIVKLKIDDFICIHYSNLQKEFRRNVIANCENGYQLSIYYGVRQGATESRVSLRCMNRCIIDLRFENDDSMLSMASRIEMWRTSRIHHNSGNSQVEFIRKFSTLMVSILESDVNQAKVTLCL